MRRAAGVPFSALLRPGAGGLPPAEPLDFATLRPPRSPNAFLAAPPGHEGPKHRTVSLLPADPDAAWAVLRSLGPRLPRTTAMKEWPELRQGQWVARTRFLNFPDLVNAQVVPLPGGAGLYLYSRSLFGWSDFGANRRRGETWIAALDALLRHG